MSKHFQKVFKALRTSEDVKALGFDKEEIKSLASDIDKKLNLQEDASDDDVESAIDEAVENAIPYLKIAQKVSSRIVKKNLSKPKDDDDDNNVIVDDDDVDDDDVDDPNGDGDHGDNGNRPNKKKRNRQPKNDDYDETKSLLKAILKRMDKQDETISSIRKGSAKDKWREKLEKIVKDTGTFGRRKLREFERLEFKDDNDFDEFLDEVIDDLEEANQERANAGLEKLGIKTAPTSRQETREQVEEITDEDIETLASEL